MISHPSDWLACTGSTIQDNLERTIRGLMALEERTALEEFYYATDGSNWINNSNWLTEPQ